MFRLKINLIGLMTAVLFAGQVFSQNMHIHKKDNTILTIPMSEIVKITYSTSTGAVTNMSSTGSGYQNSANTVTDVEGRSYKTVKIGNKVWMSEDLRTTRLNTGAVIPQIKANDEWQGMASPAYSWYDNIPDPGNGYGILYNGYAVESGYLCPTGWRLPTLDDWDDLIKNSGTMVIAGGKLKAVSSAFWASPNAGASDSFGFKALGTGYRNSTGQFMFRGTTGLWWSSSQTTFSNYSTVAMYYNYASVAKGSYPKNQGACVRCVKDDF